MNYKTVLQIISQMLIGLGIMLFIPLIATIYYQENDAFVFLASGFCSILCGLCGHFLFRSKNSIAERESFAIVTLTWLFFSLFGCLPYLFSNSGHSFTDSFFETMSGFTTTGATIFTDIESHTKGILLWRSLTQWLGGMGIVVLSLVILPFLGTGSIQLFKAEIPSPMDAKFTPRIKDTAKILWLVYIGLTIILLILLYLSNMPLYDSICHSLTTMSSGGFSPKSTGIGHYHSSLTHWIIAIFMLFSGINFSLYFQIFKGSWQKAFKDHELRTFLAAILIFSTIIYWQTGTQASDGINACRISFKEAFFTVSSIVTTTGFSLTDFSLWPVLAQGLIFVLIFFGACVGSTSGGIKITRLIILHHFAWQQLYYLLHPKAILNLKINSHVIKNNIIFGVLGFFTMYMAFFICGALILMATGLDFISSLSAAAACISNVGPGLNTVGPAGNFAHISALGKWCLIFLMLLGRLEIFTVIVLFTSAFWKD